MTLGEGGPPCPLVSVGFFPLVFFRWPTLATLYIEHAREQGGHPSRFFFPTRFLLYERDQKFVRVFVGRFSHLPNLLYYLRGRPGGPPYPVGGPLGGFQKEPTFPIYNITFMTGKVGHPSRFS